MADLENDIQQQLTELDSKIELVALQRPGSEALRLFIDHPDGVDLALCERVTKHLNHLLSNFSLEVSSPGPRHRRHASERTAGGSAVNQPASVPDSSPASEGEPKEIQ